MVASSFVAPLLLSLSLFASASPVILSFPREGQMGKRQVESPKVSVFNPASHSTPEWNLAADPEATSGSASVVSVEPIDTASSLVLFSPSADFSASKTEEPLITASANPSISGGPSAVASANANAFASASVSAAQTPTPEGSASRPTSQLVIPFSFAACVLGITLLS